MNDYRARLAAMIAADEMEECAEWTAEEIAALTTSNEAAAYTAAEITNDIDAADLYDMARDERAN